MRLNGDFGLYLSLAKVDAKKYLFMSSVESYSLYNISRKHRYISLIVFYIFNSTAVSNSSYTKFFICAEYLSTYWRLHSLHHIEAYSGYREHECDIRLTSTNSHEKSTKLNVFSSFKGKALEYRTQCSSRICHAYYTNATKDGKKN